MATSSPVIGPENTLDLKEVTAPLIKGGGLKVILSKWIQIGIPGRTNGCFVSSSPRL